MLNKVHNMDCLEGLKKLEDNSVDLVIIDPPYEIQKRGGGGSFGKKNRTYHNELLNIIDGISNDVLEELVRVMKDINIYIWCNKNQLKQFINFFTDKGASVDLLAWHKTNPTPTCSNKYLSDTEYLLFFRSHGVKVHGSYATKKKYYLSSTNKADKKLYNHPTVKPLDITKNLVVNSSLENDVVLDCYCGSGTSLVAAKELNRNYIGFEIVQEYVATSNARLNGEI